MQEITLDSREVAVMVGKEHSKLLKDIRRYIKQFNEANIGLVDFFTESAYEDTKGETRPCYQVTKKGCEFIAHKLTGTKGTEFTARYINRFHEMEADLQQKPKEPEIPWFIQKFRGSYIMLFRDFEKITGVHLSGNYTAYKRHDKLEGGRDYNGWGWRCDNEKFHEEYGFDYGDDDCMMYLYPCGILKALRIMAEEGDGKPGSRKTILDGMKVLAPKTKNPKGQETGSEISVNGVHVKDAPIEIRIIVGSKTAIM